MITRRLLLCAAALLAPPLAGSASAPTSAPLVLIAGATGGTGVHAVEHALREGYRVRVMSRRPDEARARFGDRVEIVAADVRDPATLPAAVAGASYVLSALGSRVGRDSTYAPDEVDYLGTRNLVEAAKAAGVRHFVLITAMGITQPDHPLNRMARNVLLWKGLGENALRFSGIDYTIVRPGGLRDGAGGERIVISQGDRFRDWYGPAENRPAIDRVDLAAVAVNALGRRELYGRTFEVAASRERASADWDRLFSGLTPDLSGAMPPR
jgi:uncharacterized protein YbjT (DUF2867 family)